MPPLKLFLSLAAHPEKGCEHWQVAMPKSGAGLWPMQLHASGYDAETSIMRVELVIGSFERVTLLPLITVPTFAHQWDPDQPGAGCWLPVWDEPCKLGDYISAVVRGRLQKLTVVCTNRAGLLR